MQSKCLSIVKVGFTLLTGQNQGLPVDLPQVVHQRSIVLKILVANQAEHVALRGSLVKELDLACTFRGGYSNREADSSLGLVSQHVGDVPRCVSCHHHHQERESESDFQVERESEEIYKSYFSNVPPPQPRLSAGPCWPSPHLAP